MLLAHVSQALKQQIADGGPGTEMTSHQNVSQFFEFVQISAVFNLSDGCFLREFKREVVHVSNAIDPSCRRS